MFGRDLLLPGSTGVGACGYLEWSLGTFGPAAGRDRDAGAPFPGAPNGDAYIFTKMITMV